ncbi:MAG: S-methyl-5-thioribose-1-phosphate isomerase [Anaerolineae bacterium]|nr:S-methyl-5-thioribose-1-phosphate isomerase [Anaerolineae bacterium]
MNVQGKHFRTIWLKEDDPTVVQIIDQRWLPHEFVIEDIHTVEQMAIAIQEMHLRGAGLIGAAAGYGMYLAALYASRSHREGFLQALQQAGQLLKTTRPTAINLQWAVERQLSAVLACDSPEEMAHATYLTAQAIANEDAEYCRQIGLHGLPLIQAISQRKPGQAVNILTHCNAGWLAFVDYGSATAPIYAAFEAHIPIHVWVDETRPRNQGARLTAWELGQQGVPHTLIVDNVGGHLMQHQMVDLVIVGSDRVTRTGDVANKIGTYLKALAAQDNQVPFYVALPSSTFDWTLREGVRDIPIEQRNTQEVTHMSGRTGAGKIETILLTPEQSPAANYAFDVTPARLITGLVTERGICTADEAAILDLFPEKRS